MATPDRSLENKNGRGTAEPTPVNTAVAAISLMNVHTWSDHALSVTNSVAGVVALIAAAVLLVSLGFLYFSGSALSSRVATSPVAIPEPRIAKTVDAGDRRNGGVGSTEFESLAAPSPALQRPTERANGEKAAAEDDRKVARLTQELTEARLAAEARRADLDKLQRDLAEAQKSDKAKTERVTRLESDFETVKRSEQEKTSRVAQLEDQLGQVQKSEAGRDSRLAQLEKDLEVARKPSAQKVPPPAEGPDSVPETARNVTPAQREQFLHAVQGRATGKVIVSAFFENKETHDFGRTVIGLLRAAGFEVVEQAPVNFFTTSRPSSGVRIGCEDMSHPPAHFVTIRKGFEAMGIEIPDASIVNAQEPNVVEIQITPKE